jgi:hypothetical protein
MSITPEPEQESEVVPEDEETSSDETEPVDYPGEAGDRGEDWQPHPDEEEVDYQGER